MRYDLNGTEKTKTGVAVRNVKYHKNHERYEGEIWLEHLKVKDKWLKAAWNHQGKAIKPYKADYDLK